MRTFLLGLAALLSVVPVHAQDYIPYVEIQAANIHYGNMLEKMYDRRDNAAPSAGVGQGASQPRSGYRAGVSSLASPVDAGNRPAFLGYKPTLALRRETVNGLVERASRKNPEAARLMAIQYAKHDYAKVYSGLIAGAGLRENDAADASTAYTLLGWQIANRDPAEITNAKVAAVRNQVAARLAANPQLSSPSVRASLGEEMKLLYVTLHAGWQGAVREGTTKAYSDGITEMFKVQAQSDLRALRLTNDGFKRR